MRKLASAQKLSGKDLLGEAVHNLEAFITADVHNLDRTAFVTADVQCMQLLSHQKVWFIPITKRQKRPLNMLKKIYAAIFVNANYLKYLPALSKLGFHDALKGLPCCWSKQYLEWSQEAEASLKKVKEAEGHTERLKPELRLVKSEFMCWRWLLLLLRKAESPDPSGKLCRGFNSEMLASCRQLRFFWRETSRHSPVNKMVWFGFKWHSMFKLFTAGPTKF